MALDKYAQFHNSIVELLSELSATNDSLSNLDVRTGTAFDALFISPAALLFQNFYERLTTLEDYWSLQDYTDLSEDVMDKLASNFQIQRLKGEKSRGIVRISLSAATKIFIPTGTIFTSDTGLRFLTIQDYTFTKDQVLINQDTVNGGYYVSMIVESEKSGSEYTIEPGKITTMSSDIGLTYSRVTNPDAFYGGSGSSETNTQVYDRIQRSITLRNFVSDNGISLLIDEYFGTTVDKLIIGSGDPLMMRDRVYDIETYPLDIYPYGPQVIKDFKGKILGDDLWCSHNAYYCISTTRVEDWETFTDEFTQDDYVQLFYDDGDAFILRNDYILDETFESITTLSDDWITGEDGLDWGTSILPNEVGIISLDGGNVMVLGVKSPDINPKLFEHWVKYSYPFIITPVINHLEWIKADLVLNKSKHWDFSHGPVLE